MTPSTHYYRNLGIFLNVLGVSIVLLSPLVDVLPDSVAKGLLRTFGPIVNMAIFVLAGAALTRRGAIDDQRRIETARHHRAAEE